jgi:hypothetical protein
MFTVRCIHCDYLGYNIYAQSKPSINTFRIYKPLQLIWDSKRSFQIPYSGVDYTPTYIVDYIVKNTLGQMLKEKRDGQIKVLDLSSGQGL